jgi:two-component system, NarL family, nitrate/nitrite response regulator NarL
VVLADDDPISQQVLAVALRRSERVNLVACVDSRRPVDSWPLDAADVAIVAVTCEDEEWLIRTLVARLPVVLLGVRWTRARMSAAFAAGASGCLDKAIDVRGLAAAADAVAAGFMVLTPRLFHNYRAQVPQPRRHESGPDPVRLFRSLTARERQVLTLLVEGRSTGEVAAALNVSAATVKSHISHSLTKLGVRNRLEAVLIAQRALGQLT